MPFDWEQLKPNHRLTEPQKRLVREIGENFLLKGTGIPDHQKKVELKKERNVLNELVQVGLIRNNWNHYYPTFQALYYLSDTLRDNYAEMLHLIFKAIQALYEDSGPQRFSLQQVEQQVNLLISASSGTLAWRGGNVYPHRAALFLLDFTRLVSVQESSPDTPVAAVVATDNILDYEDLQLAWREELALRPSRPNLPVASVPLEEPKEATSSNSAQPKTDLGNVTVTPPSPTPSPSTTHPELAKSIVEVAVRALSDKPATLDLLEFGDYADALIDLIQSPKTQTPLTIGIDGPWGSGKTTLMGMMRDRLDRERGETNKEPKAHTYGSMPGSTIEKRVCGRRSHSKFSLRSENR